MKLRFRLKGGKGSGWFSPPKGTHAGGQNVGDSYYDKKSRLGNVNINGYDIAIGEDAVGYKKDGFTPIVHLVVTVAHDYNRSNRFTIHAATLKGLLGKIRGYDKGKLVKPKGR